MILAIKSSLALPFKPMLWCVAVLMGSSGCGEEGNLSKSEYAGTKTAGGIAAPPAATAPVVAPAEGAVEQPPAQPRRIIYNAQVTLVVESLTAASQQITQLVQASGGYVSETDTNIQSHAPRTGTWKVRIPVAKFDAFMASVSKLGELQHTHVDSQDVSQEYYDLEARISNKQQEEKRLLKHLADSTGKLEDILAVERELSRVRGEIEQMQGRIRYLTHQTDLSTVTITALEVKDYTPPVSPTLSTEITRTFGQSVSHLGEFVRGLLLFCVAVFPWFVVIALVSVPLWWLVRRLRRRA
ncbi:DUF4349 domain-containing protein [Singulisphaera acidiphila]|uniref:DUF4349 domain-containing protein n=1 Tax=Singulisphaera acidiphila (strain ATCC BAA-1392 / DSM 18658 / VKM B-2454 / MOB10) TaxID=886293 RepID=L0DEZ1_SINAD|nr:DUF4349 domain-containing protein [Singulisphaera acidiphila]AGA27251.1 hypothetical protein Sinac_2967 [Singulisphaera acidiphila DSM 18658]